jgi:TRAP transporter TAXI family solute receptor
MTKIDRRTLVALGGAGLAAAALPAPLRAQSTYNLTAAGLGATGVMATINAGFSAAVEAAFPGSVITYQTSSGGIENIVRVDMKQVPLGYAVDVELQMALNGVEPFRGRIDSWRTIALLGGWVPMHAVIGREVADRHGLRTVADIGAKKAPIRVVFNTRGNVTSIISEELFKAFGFSTDDLKSWGGDVIYAAGRDHPGLMGDRRVDMMFNMTPAKGSVMATIERSRDLATLYMDKAVVDRVAEQVGAQPITLPAGTYAYQDQDFHTVTIAIALIAHRDMPDATAYDLAKALVSQLPRYQAAHPSHVDATREYLVSLRIGQYHPGALRYYREAGMVSG